jgi:hypothetical protein
MAFVRAEAPDGSRFTIDEGAVETLGSKVLKGTDAVDVNGRPLPPEPAPEKGGKAASEKKEA